MPRRPEPPRLTRVLGCRAATGTVWELISRPDRWSEWSLYVRGAEGLGDPEVKAGAKGRVIVAGGLKVPAEILEVEPGRSWSWKVGGVIVDHVVEPDGHGSRLSMPVRSAGPAWAPVALAYAPIVDLFTSRIVAIAEAEAETKGAG